MKYNWIFFDADDTLFDFKRSAHQAFSRTLEFFQIEMRSGHYEIYKMVNQEVWTAFENKEISAIELRRIRFEKFLHIIGEYRDPLEMNSHYLRELSTTDYLVEGAREVMETLLDQDVKLCLITNGLKEVQRPRVERARLTAYFKAIIVSDEIGVAKPHAGFFRHAFEETGNPGKDSVLVVGDSLSSDIQGGNQFGVDTCWYNPAGAMNHSGHEPTYQIRHLKEVKKILQG